MRNLMSILLLSAMSAATYAETKPKEMLAAALSANGECYYERDGKAEFAKAKTIFFKGDRVYTMKGKMDVQIGPNAVLHLAPYSTVKLVDLSEMDKKASIAVDLEGGRGYTKFTKKMSPGSKYTIKTPTTVAAVRGTEFILSAGDQPPEAAEDSDIPAGVFVNHGKVAVSPVNRENEVQEVSQGEQIQYIDNAAVKAVMEDFIKKKMELFKKLDTMREAQYRILEREKNRQIEALEKVRNSVKFDSTSTIDKFREKNQNLPK